MPGSSTRTRHYQDWIVPGSGSTKTGQYQNWSVPEPSSTRLLHQDQAEPGPGSSQDQVVPEPGSASTRQAAAGSDSTSARQYQNQTAPEPGSTRVRQHEVWVAPGPGSLPGLGTTRAGHHQNQTAPGPGSAAPREGMVPAREGRGRSDGTDSPAVLLRPPPPRLPGRARRSGRCRGRTRFPARLRPEAQILLLFGNSSGDIRALSPRRGFCASLCGSLRFGRVSAEGRREKRCLKG